VDDVGRQSCAPGTAARPISGGRELKGLEAQGSATSSALNFGGGSTLNIVGAIFAANTDVTVLGNNGSAKCTQVVAKTITFHGNNSFKHDCTGIGISDPPGGLRRSCWCSEYGCSECRYPPGGGVAAPDARLDEAWLHGRGSAGIAAVIGIAVMVTLAVRMQLVMLASVASASLRRSGTGSRRVKFNLMGTEMDGACLFTGCAEARGSGNMGTSVVRQIADLRRSADIDRLVARLLSLAADRQGLIARAEANEALADDLEKQERHRSLFP
jgi:hypothetical protein